MDPQQPIPPDPPDDDPDQHADQPPPYPSPALLDSALSLVAQPLASAAARVAASHPIAYPLEDLNDFNVDLSWAATEIDAAFLNDTQYLQLGDDPHPPHPPHPSSTPSHPLPSVSTTATAAIPLSIPDSQPIPPVSLSAQTLPSVPTPNHDPPPFPRSGSSSLPRKPSRNRLPQPNLKHNPIPIAPRSLTNAKRDLERKSASPAPRSMQAQSSLREAPKPVSTPPPPRQTPHPASASASREKYPTQSPPTPFTRFPRGMSPHPMMPIMNMYPLQHHQSVCHPSQSACSPHDIAAPHSRPIHRPAVSRATHSTDVPPVTADPTPAPSSHPTQPQNAPQQPFLSPPIPVMPQGVVPYDTNIMPFFQMAYAAAAAAYPHGVVPPLPARSPNIPPTMLNPYSPDRSTSFNPDNNQSTPAQPQGPATIDQATQQASAVNVKTADGPIVVQKAGKQVFVPQQKAARLERHPVLGRLQLKSASKPQVATSMGLESNYVSETNMPVRDDEQKSYLRPSHMATSSTNAGPPPANVGPSFASLGPSPANAGPSVIAPNEAAQRQQKKRLVWTQELHERFVKAISAVGLNNAVPKTIVTIMNVEGLTTEHVKSHLQKYRNSMRKEAAEEERDRSGGIGSSTDLRHHKFRAPSTGAARGIHTATLTTPPGDANRSSQIGTVVTNPVGRQTLSFLPSRMNAFSGQMKEMLQPRVTTGISKETTNSVVAPKPGTNIAIQISGPTSLKSNSTQGGTCHKAVSSDSVPLVAAKKQSVAASETQEWRPDDAMKDSARESFTEKPGAAENVDATKQAASRANTAQPRNDRSVEQGPPTAGLIGTTEQAEPTAALKESTTAAADVSPSQNDRSGMDDSSVFGSGQADDRQKNVTTLPKANAGVDNAASTSQGNRDLELEFMKEETQQMQLQVQMMVYRTIALEKKLEEMHSERLNAEVSGRVDSSKRSTGGDALPVASRIGGSKMKREAEVNESERAESAKEMENVTVQEENEKNAEGENQDQVQEIRTKKRPRSLAGEGQTEVEALLGEQMGLQKRLKNASALIDKRMKTDGDDFVNEKRREQEWHGASGGTGKDDGICGNKDRSGVDLKLTAGQGRNG